MPANIEIGGEPCNLVSFDMANLPYTTFVCSSPAQPASTEYYGNRGITLIEDNIYWSDLTKAIPSVNATFRVLNQASYSTSLTSEATVWFKGFFSPQKDSDYDFYFELRTGWPAILYLSNDSTSANMVISFLFFSIQ